MHKMQPGLQAFMAGTAVQVSNLSVHTLLTMTWCDRCSQ